MPDTQAEQQLIGIIAQYTKDLSFENINPVSQLQDVSTDQSQIDIQMRVEVAKNNEEPNVYGVSLIVHIEAKIDKPMFILELNYAGEFAIEGFAENLIDPILYIECPRLLFPFARSIIANTVSDGGFPPLYLTPVNFAELYQQQEDTDYTLQ